MNCKTGSRAESGNGLRSCKKRQRQINARSKGDCSLAHLFNLLSPALLAPWLDNFQRNGALSYGGAPVHLLIKGVSSLNSKCNIYSFCVVVCDKNRNNAMGQHKLHVLNDIF